MSTPPNDPADPTDPVESLRRANRVLRERVAELERQLARSGAGAPMPLGSALSEREALLAEAERIAHIGSWLWDLGTNEVRWSDELFRILGYDPTTDLASPDAFFARVHPDDRARVQATSARGIAAGESEQVDYRVLRPDGSVRHVTMDAALLFGADGSVQRAVGTVLDVTEAREAARSLRRTAELLADAQRIANVGSFEAEVGGGAHYWSAQMYRILDLDPTHPPSTEDFLARLHHDDRGPLAAAIERALATGEVEPARARVIHRDGSLHHIETAAVAVRDEEGGLRSVRGTISDVTELVRLEAQFHQSQKMEAIGLLAGGLAHDFNNLLAIILGNVELALRERPSPELREVVTATVAARDLTSRLLTLGRQRMPHGESVRLADALAEAEPLLRRAVGELVQVRVTATDTWAVRAQAAPLQQVLLNLALNARDAMPDGGTLNLVSRHQALGPGLASRHRVKAGDHVVLEVTDTGVGMDEATLARAFEPFFSTKPRGEGSGLGLAMVFGTMRQVGGFIEVSSRIGEGTTFRLWFPRAAEAPTAPAPTPQSTRRRARILLVEDNPAVARVTHRVLAAAGYPVRTAADGKAALAGWRAEPADVLVTDIRMPGMSGIALAQQVRALAPSVPVLFVSGHTHEPVELADRGGRSAFLMKPYTGEELLAALAGLLGEPGAGGGAGGR